MAKKSQRRRATRELSPKATAATATVGHHAHAVEPRLRDGDWKNLEKTLPFLLSVEIQSASTAADADPLCPRAAWLVVHVDRVCVKPPAQSKKGRSTPCLLERLTAVVDAVSVLCDEAYRLRKSPLLHAQFWTRLMNSDILEAPPAEMESWLRYVNKHGTPVLFSWCSKPLEARPMVDSLRGFLATGSRFQGHPRLGSIGFRFESCALSALDLEMIHVLLRCPELGDGDTNGQVTPLSENHVVGLLSVSGNALDTAALNELAILSEDPNMPVIRELRLDGIMPTEAEEFMSPGYLVAYQRVLSPPPTSTERSRSTALSLSLSRDVPVDGGHLQALRECLLLATRPLCSLQIANLRPNGPRAWFQLAKLLLSNLPTAKPECELTFSWTDDVGNLFLGRHAFYDALDDFVIDAVPKLRTNSALTAGPVVCRLLNGAVFEDQLLSERMACSVIINGLHPVQEISVAGQFRIALPDAAALGWVSSRSISRIQIGDSAVVGSSFTSLVFENSGNSLRSYASRSFLWDLMAVLGPSLKRLSLRNCPRISRQLMSLLTICPILNELDLENSPMDFEYVKECTSMPGSAVQVLKIAGCSLDHAAFQSLGKLQELRYLSVKHNAVGQEGLQTLLHWLRESDHLRFIELSNQPNELNSEGDLVNCRRDIDHLVRYEVVSKDTILAFLSVLASRKTPQSATKYLTTESTAQIFAFAGRKDARIVKWC